MPYDPDKHHRRSIRLQEYDYDTPGAYFVTVVCQHRECLIDPDPVRAMLEAWWDKLPVKFPVIETDEFVIMPNHIHGIIAITASAEPNPSLGQVRPHTGQTRGSAPTLGEIMQWFKTMTTNAYICGVKQEGWTRFPGKLWQRNYYERVIRNERELHAIREYIVHNPANWEKDSENPDAAVRACRPGQIP